MATFEEEAVGHQGMEMGMSAGVISETFAEITAFEVFANDMWNDRPIKIVFLLEEIVIALLEYDTF